MQFSSKSVRQINLIVLLLKSNVHYSFDDIRNLISEYKKDNFETGKKLFERDKKELRNMGIEVQCLDQKFYTIDRNDFYLSDLKLEEDEAAMLVNMIKIAGELAESMPMKRELFSALRKIEIVSGVNGENGDNNPIDYLQQIRGDVDINYRKMVRTIIESIVNRQRVHINYRKVTEDKDLERLIDPLGLIIRDGIPYCIGFCHIRKDIRIFNLSRMEIITKRDIEPDEKPFTAPTGFNIKDYKKREIWELGQENPYPAEIFFDKDIAWYVKNRFEDSVEIEDLSDGILLKPDVKNTEGILQFILSFGNHCEVKEPEFLRALIRDEINHIINEYDELL